MNHVYRPSFSPRPERPPVPFPPPSPEALHDPAAADTWLQNAADAAADILYRDRPGMPHREPHDSQVLARAYAAEPTSKTWLNAILMAAGQLPHIAGGAAVSDGAARLLYRLAALLSREGCEKGDYRLTVCNATLAHELGRTVRSIRRYLSELQASGWIYRHFTTGPIGLARPAIDLGPTVQRLTELEDEIAGRAEARADQRADRARCATLGVILDQEESGGEDRAGPLNTDDSESLSGTVSAQEGSVAGKVSGKPQQGADVKGFFHPGGRPAFTPKPRLVLDHCPTLAAYVGTLDPTWFDLIEAAGRLASRWDLHSRVWQTLCLHLGREWAALTVATVAELPNSHFTLSRAATPELRRAGYVSGIAKKLEKGQAASVAASWFRHLKTRSN
nr:hypothetical protein [uncultured Acidocella sp.]